MTNEQTRKQSDARERGTRMLALAVASLACNSTRQGEYPSNNPFTTNASGSAPDKHCCAVMPRIPLIDAAEPGAVRQVRLNVWSRGSSMRAPRAGFQ